MWGNNIKKLSVAVIAIGAMLFDNSVILAADTTKPTISSIARYSTTSQNASTANVVWRVTFSEDVRNVDKSDFALSGTAATPSKIAKVTEVSQSVYDVEVTTADGTLNLIVRTAVDNIQDLVGNPYDDLVASTQGYVLGVLPVITITQKTKTDTATIADTKIVVTDDTSITAAGVVVDTSSTATTSDLKCVQTNTKKVTCSIDIDSTGTLVVKATDAAGNTTTKSQVGYTINNNIKIDKPSFKLTSKAKRIFLSKKKRISVTKKSVSFSGEVPELAGGEVKVYDNKKKLKTKKIDSKGKWKQTVSFKKDGKYSLKFKFYDKHGKKIDTIGSYKVRVDTEKPKFIDLPQRLTKRVGQKVWWVATDNDKIKRYRYEWRGKKIKTTKSHFFIPANTPRGEHTLTVRAYDRAGNKSDKSVVITVR